MGRRKPETTNLVDTTQLSKEGLSPKVIKRIKKEKRTRRFRTISGYPWWVRYFTSKKEIETLKEEGLL